MEGLLGNLGNFIKSPEGQGLLSAAFGGMAGARPGQPWNTAGRAGMAGLLGYQGAQENLRQNELYGMQTKEMRNKIETQERIRQAARDSMLSPEQVALSNGQGPTVANAAKIATAAPQVDQQRFMSQVWGIDPLQAISMQASMAKDNPYAKVDPKDYTPESVARFSQTKNYADLMPVRKLDVVNNQAVDLYRTQPGTVFDDMDPNKPFGIRGGQAVPNQPFQNFALNKAERGATRLNVTTKQEGEEAKTVGKGFGEQYVGLQSGGMDANNKITRLERMRSLMDGVQTGKAEPTKMQLAAMAESFGIKNFDPDLGAKQAIEALSNELALQMRNPAGGAGMPGAMSDKDREFLVNITPGMSKTKEGNRLIIDTGIRLAQRDRDVARLARDYRKKHGAIDEGFYDELERFAIANPLFGGLTPVADPESPNRPSVDDLLKKYGGM